MSEDATDKEEHSAPKCAVCGINPAQAAPGIEPGETDGFYSNCAQCHEFVVMAPWCACLPWSTKTTPQVGQMDSVPFVDDRPIELLYYHCPNCLNNHYPANSRYSSSLSVPEGFGMLHEAQAWRTVSLRCQAENRFTSPPSRLIYLPAPLPRESDHDYAQRLREYAEACERFTRRRAMERTEMERNR